MRWSWSTPCAQEELAVAVAAGDRALEPVDDGEADRCARLAELALDLDVGGRVPDDAAFADVLRLQLELRLHEQEQVARGERRERGQDERERDEREVADDQIEAADG